MQKEEEQTHEQETRIKRMNILEMQGQDNFSFEESGMTRKSVCMCCSLRHDFMIVLHLLMFYATNGLLLISLFHLVVLLWIIIWRGSVV